MRWGLGGGISSTGATRTTLLHQAVDLEPVGSPAVSGARLGHPNHQTFSQSAGFTGSSVLLVDNTSAVVLTFSDHRLELFNYK